MDHSHLHPELFLLGALAVVTARWLPRSGWIALALAAVPFAGFALIQQFC